MWYTVVKFGLKKLNYEQISLNILRLTTYIEVIVMLIYIFIATQRLVLLWLN